MRFHYFFLTLVLVALGAYTPAIAQEGPGGSAEASPDAATAYGAAVKAQSEGRYDDALRLIGEAQRLDPEHGGYIWRRVLILEEMGEPALALNVLEEQRERIVTFVPQERIEQKEADLDADIAGMARGELEEDPTLEHTEGEPPPRPSPTLGYVLTGAGATFLSTAAVLFLLARSDKIRLDCSTGSRDDCDGVTPIDNLDAAEIDRRDTRVTTLATAGWISAGAGIGLLAWGLYELFTFAPGSHETVGVAPMLGADNVGAVFIWRM